MHRIHHQEGDFASTGYADRFLSRGMVQWEPDQSSRLGLALGLVRLSFEFPTSM